MNINYNDLAAISQLSLDESLARYTAARLGGFADAIATVQSTEALLQAVKWARQNHVPWVVIGGGANILVSDAGFRGLVIANHAKNVQIAADSGRVWAASGVTLTTLARRCIKQGLKGFEWAVSVPGSVGGAVVNNAGAHGGDMAGNVSEAEVVDFEMAETPSTWPVNQFQYAYRFSVLKGQPQRYVVLNATLQLEPGHDAKQLTAIADDFVAYRKKTQPPGASLGSIFKNPPGDYAGRLIEAAGLKGFQVGGVQVSPVHANFIVNMGNGTASDYNQLIETIQQTVHEKLGVALELEIERVGDVWR